MSTTKEFFTKEIINNLVQMMKVTPQLSPHDGANFEEHNGFLRYFSGSKYPTFNGIFLNYENNTPEIIDYLNKSTTYFNDKKVPFMLWWTQQIDIPSDIKLKLCALNFQVLGEYSGIAANANDIKFTSVNEKIKVKYVDSEEEYEKLIQIQAEVLQLPENIVSDFRQMNRPYGPQGKFNHYLGYYDGEPVSTATSYIVGDAAGLYSWVTVEKARKKGLCSALAQQSIKDAIGRGCKYLVSQLESAGMAKDLTNKMGFTQYCKLQPWFHP